MGEDEAATLTQERFVVEMDGQHHSEHAHFAEALKVALLLRDDFAERKIKLRDLALKAA